MISASEMRAGMAIRFENRNYKVIAAEYHPGQGKMGGQTHARLRSLDTGALWEHSFRADLKMEDLVLERKGMDYLYSAEGMHVFMDPGTCEQAEIPEALLGARGRFLKPGMRVLAEFLGERQVSAVLADYLEVTVAGAAPPIHAQQDSTWKTAVLDNGVEVLVPQFIKAGDVIRIDLEALKYMSRA